MRQERDFAMEALLRQRVEDAVRSVEDAKQAKDTAVANRHSTEQRRRGTAKALGDVFPRSAPAL